MGNTSSSSDKLTIPIPKNPPSLATNPKSDSNTDQLKSLKIKAPESKSQVEADKQVSEKYRKLEEQFLEDEKAAEECYEFHAGHTDCI